MKTSILVRLSYEATHSWPQVEDFAGKEVGYLKYPHRHIFHVECRKEVTKLDREIEIILFKRKILSFLDSTYSGDLKFLSCEMLATQLLTTFGLSFCQVTEDGENGAICEK